MDDSGSPTGDDFFAWVAEYLTPAMARHGYVVCWSGEGKASDSGSRLVRLPGWRAHPLLRRRTPMRRRGLVRHLSVGYEGPEFEYTVDYFPERQGMDWSPWRDVLNGHADWNLFEDEPLSRTEMHRRLRVLGRAVHAAESLED